MSWCMMRVRANTRFAPTARYGVACHLPVRSGCYTKTLFANQNHLFVGAQHVAPARETSFNIPKNGKYDNCPQNQSSVGANRVFARVGQHLHCNLHQLIIFRNRQKPCLNRGRNVLRPYKKPRAALRTRPCRKNLFYNLKNSNLSRSHP
jgi:hypothetical protein